jgi:hypothetical protein
VSSKPGAGHSTFFFIEILFHINERFDDNINALPKLLSGKIVIQNLHLFVFANGGKFALRGFRHYQAKSAGKIDCALRICHPHTLHFLKMCAVFRHCFRNKNGDISFNFTLIIF